MLETVVIVLAAVVCVALVALMFYVAHQQDLNLQRRVEDAEAGGRPLSPDETATVKVRGIRPSPPDEDRGGWYARYRRRNALTRTHAVIGMLMLSYMVVFALVVDLLGLPLGFITMYPLGLAAAGVYVLLSRRYGGRTPR